MPYTMEKIIVQPKFINPQYHKQKLTKSCILMRKQIHSFQFIQKKRHPRDILYQLSSSKSAKIGKLVLQSTVLWKEKKSRCRLLLGLRSLYMKKIQNTLILAVDANGIWLLIEITLVFRMISLLWQLLRTKSPTSQKIGC